VITGCVVVDLAAVAEDRQRHRIAALAGAPHGAAVEVLVGAIKVGPEAARLIRSYAGSRNLSIVVKGEAFSVGNWVSALRTGELCGVLL